MVVISDIKELYYQSICHGISWCDETNPLLSHNFKMLKNRITNLKRKITRTKTIHHSIKINRTRIMDAIYKKKWRRYDIISQFELQMASLQNLCCHKCHSVYVGYDNHRSKYICQLCQHDNKGTNENQSYQAPIWIDDKLSVQYDIPLQLQGLTLGEKLLIQKYSPYIPIVHIRHGTLALKGHCICFPKDVASVSNKLPRIDCSVVRYIRHYGTRNDEALSKYDGFIIRKYKVMNALIWLQQHNPLYREGEIIIEVNNLSWMGDKDEAELPNIIDINDDECTNQTLQSFDNSVSRVQTDVHNDASTMEYDGAVSELPRNYHGDNEKK